MRGKGTEVGGPWGHQIRLFEFLSRVFEARARVPQTRSEVSSPEYLQGSCLVELDLALEVCRLDLRIDLRGVDPSMTEQLAHRLQVPMMFEHLHGHAMAQIVRLEHGLADQSPVRFAEPPDVPGRPRRRQLSSRPQPLERFRSPTCTRPV
jgi:hypothetical protein